MRFGGQKWKKSKIKIWNLEEKEKFLLWKYAYFSRNMKGKVIYKPFFIFFVDPLRGPSPLGKLTLKNLKTHFSFFLYIYTPKLGVALILKGFFVFMTHPSVEVLVLVFEGRTRCISCTFVGVKFSARPWCMNKEEVSRICVNGRMLKGSLAGDVFVL